MRPRLARAMSLCKGTEATKERRSGDDADLRVSVRERRREDEGAERRSEVVERVDEDAIAKDAIFRVRRGRVDWVGGPFGLTGVALT